MIIRWLEAIVAYFPLKPPTHHILINSFANQPLKPSRTHAAVTHARGTLLLFARFAYTPSAAVMAASILLKKKMAA